MATGPGPQTGSGAPGLQIRLYGPFEVTVDGQPLSGLYSRKGRWLLALLALRPGREVQRSWLAGTLWPEAPEDRALYYLRRELAHLRRALGAEARRLRSPGVHSLILDLAGLDLDVVEFDEALRRGDEASLARAIDLRRGPFLEGCTDEWALPERRVRDEAFLGALEALGNAAMRRGDAAGAVHCFRQAVALDPLRESVYRELMRALVDSGDPAPPLRPTVISACCFTARSTQRRRPKRLNCTSGSGRVHGAGSRPGQRRSVTLGRRQDEFRAG